MSQAALSCVVDITEPGCYTQRTSFFNECKCVIFFIVYAITVLPAVPALPTQLHPLPSWIRRKCSLFNPVIYSEDFELTVLVIPRSLGAGV